MIDWTEIADGDTWELFARDFLSEMGFIVEVAPGRGPDGGRDLVVSEQLQGTLFGTKFTWLVSCKHNAEGGTSVGVAQEVDVTDRCKRNGSSGFMGFYSTMASAGLVDRLKTHRDNKDIQAFEIFDHKRIEARIVASGMTKIVLRYMPESYGKIRPIQNILGKYAGLDCEVCDKDLLEESVNAPFRANLIWATKDSGQTYDNVYVTCKHPCDQILTERLDKQGFITGWDDLSDLCNPIIYIQNIMAYMNHLHLGHPKYTPAAHDKMKEVYLAISQRTLREINEEDEERVKELKKMGYHLKVG